MRPSPHGMRWKLRVEGTWVQQVWHGHGQRCCQIRAIKVPNHVNADWLVRGIRRCSCCRDCSSRWLRRRGCRCRLRRWRWWRRWWRRWRGCFGASVGRWRRRRRRRAMSHRRRTNGRMLWLLLLVVVVVLLLVVVVLLRRRRRWLDIRSTASHIRERRWIHRGWRTTTRICPVLHRSVRPSRAIATVARTSFTVLLQALTFNGRLRNIWHVEVVVRTTRWARSGVKAPSPFLRWKGSCVLWACHHSRNADAFVSRCEAIHRVHLNVTLRA